MSLRFVLFVLMLGQVLSLDDLLNELNVDAFNILVHSPTCGVQSLKTTVWYPLKVFGLTRCESCAQPQALARVRLVATIHFLFEEAEVLTKS